MADETIVLLDADDTYRRDFAEALRRGGYHILQCREAQQAWENVADHEPTMIISELGLPDATGMALLRAYRRAFPHRTTPFVFLSHEHDPSQIVRSLEAGADDHWSKVHSVDEVAVRVTAALRRRRKSDPGWSRDCTHLSQR